MTCFCHLPRNVTEAGGDWGSTHKASCILFSVVETQLVAGVGMGCLQWSSGPLCMSPSRRITALPPPHLPAPPPGVETTFPGTIAPGLRLAAQGPSAHQLRWESPCGAVLVPGGWAHEHQPDPPSPPPPRSGLQEQGSQQHASEARAHYPPVLG